MDDWKRLRERINCICTWFTLKDHVAAFYETVRLLRPGQTYLEIGTWLGCTAAFAALATPPGVRIVTIDNGKYWMEVKKADLDQYRAAISSNFEKVGISDRVDFWLGNSSDFARSWSGPIDVLFIDGNHTLEGVNSDIRDWVCHVVPEGYVMFDDYNRNATPGVKQAVDELLPAPEWEFIREAQHLAILRKAKSVGNEVHD